jgi:SAM-dependent methyltransferase
VTSSSIDPVIIRRRYNSRLEIWPVDDVWHRYTYERLIAAVNRLTRALGLRNKTILNLGSGGNGYGINADSHVHLDLADIRLPQVKLAAVGTAECLPFKNNSFDFVLCVGAVLNYCDAAAAISEIARVLTPTGILFLEFESSESAEYLWTSKFGIASTFVTTNFQGEPESLWLYNPSYIIGLLKAVGMSVMHNEGFHAITAFIFRLTRNERFAIRFVQIDRLIFVRTLFRRFACNRILLAKKSMKST